MGTSIKGINKIHPKSLAIPLDTFKDDAKGVYQKFRLIDDDIWLKLADEYSKYFKL